MSDDGEPRGYADTSVTVEELLRLIESRTDAALDPDDNTKPEHTCENLNDVAAAILERNADE